MAQRLHSGRIIINDDAELRSFYSVWYHCHYIDTSKMRVSGGPVETNPDGSTLGGWQLDNVVEYLYWDAAICTDWDGVSDLELCVMFECNVDNTGGNVADTVDLDLTVWYKAFDAAAVRTQTIATPIIVGQAAQYTLFHGNITIDWDYESNVVLAQDIISGRVNLNTGNSEVDNIIINHMCFRYKTKKPRLEVS